jgi:ABC-type Co2+ transport system permease subunit
MMHIEPGIVDGTKMAIGYATAAGVISFTARGLLQDLIKGHIGRLIGVSLIATLLTFLSFEVLPHPTVGVSEVHLILGSTMLLLLGVAPTALGMMAGLALQGFIFAPSDLPQFGMNVTTLLASLFATAAVAKRFIPAQSRYVDLSYKDVVKLSLLFQGSIVAWVSFWVILGQGAGVSTLQSIGTFGSAYLSVIAIEVALNIALLAALRGSKSQALKRTLNPRLFAQASF